MLKNYLKNLSICIYSIHWGYLWFLLWELVCIYAIREMLLDFLNQSVTKINANNRIAKGLTAFKNAVKAPSFAFAA